MGILKLFGVCAAGAFCLAIVAGVAQNIRERDPEYQAQQAQIAAANAARLEESKANGTYCLSQSTYAMRRTIKQNLRDPDSFQYIEAGVTPKGEDGKHIVLMQFRAKNGFGGYAVSTAGFRMDGDTCQFTYVGMQ